MSTPDAPITQPKAARNRQKEQQERQLLEDLITEIRRGLSEAERFAYGIEISKDKAKQLIRRYERFAK